MKKILLPTDFSTNALNAVRYALSMFRDEACHFTLLNSFDIPYADPDVPFSMSDIVADNAEKSFNRLLNNINTDFPQHHFHIETDFRIGEVTSVIKKVAREKKIDLIIMGTQGASGLQEVLVGSQTTQVIKHSHCPVLAIPEKSSYIPPRKIVLAVDDEEDLSSYALLPLTEIAEKFNSHILLLHVIGKNKPDRPLKAEKAKQYFKALKHSYHTIYKEKIPEGIEEFIHDHDASMLAMLTHELNLFESIFHKSITRKMAMHTKIPLLAMQLRKDE